MRLPHTLEGLVPLTFHCRDFKSFSLSFKKERDAVDVFESVRGLTVACELNLCGVRYAFVHKHFSNCHTVICIPLHSKSAVNAANRMVTLFSEGRVCKNGTWYSYKGLEILGYK
jgi:hypothetical protein